jgi:hypothetical protein
VLQMAYQAWTNTVPPTSSPSNPTTVQNALVFFIKVVSAPAVEDDNEDCEENLVTEFLTPEMFDELMSILLGRKPVAAEGDSSGSDTEVDDDALLDDDTLAVKDGGSHTTLAEEFSLPVDAKTALVASAIADGAVSLLNEILPLFGFGGEEEGEEGPRLVPQDSIHPMLVSAAIHHQQQHTAPREGESDIFRQFLRSGRCETPSTHKGTATWYLLVLLHLARAYPGKGTGPADIAFHSRALLSHVDEAVIRQFQQISLQ